MGICSEDDEKKQTNTMLKASASFVALFLMFATTTAKPQAAAGTSPANQTTTPLSEAEKYRLTQEELIHHDWPNLERYQKANAMAGLPAAGENRVVFYGDSITDGWIVAVPDFFAGNPILTGASAGRQNPTDAGALPPGCC